MNLTEQQNQEIELSQYFEILYRRRWILLAVLIITVLSTALYTFTRVPVFESSALLVIEKERGSSSIYSNGTMVESNNEDYYETQYKLLKSESLLERVYSDLGLRATKDFQDPKGLEKLRKAVSISPVLRSRLVYVRSESTDPMLAAKIANHLSSTFVDQNLTHQLFISKEVLTALQGEANDSQKIYESLPAVVNNTLIQQLKGKLSELEAGAADLAARYTAKHPARLANQGNVDALRRQIADETDRIIQSLKSELSGKLKGNNVRIVDPAKVPTEPIRPNKPLALLLGIFGGMVLGFAAALLAEIIDRAIRSQEDVEKKLNLPFLGVIPQGVVDPKARCYAPLLSKELSLSSEAFRSLRTMLGFAEVGTASKALMVTSTVQEEGKSHVAVNVAVAFAQMGEEVLIIDGDLRRPTLHKKLRISNEKGLSEFLAAGQNVEEAEALLQDTDVPNLKAITCGVRPPNPAELLSTPRVNAILEWAKSRFDRVIIDCTPLFPISDTLLWGRHVKPALFVVRYGRTRTPLVQRAVQRALTRGIKVLGVAINGAKEGGLLYASNKYYTQEYYQHYAHAETSSSG